MTIVPGMHASTSSPAAAIDPDSNLLAQRRSPLWLAITSPKGELVSATIAGLLLLVGFAIAAASGSESGAALGHGLYWGSLCIGMFHGGRAAWASLAERKFDIDVLMVVGAALAAWVGAPGEGALLLFLFVLSGALEDLAMARTTRAVEALHKLMPTAAMKWTPGAEPGAAAPEQGHWVHVDPEHLAVGDRIKVLPGEIIPSDASVLVGDSSIDQANLTGESVPRSVHVGSDLYAGTINVGNPIEATVTRLAKESSLQRILNLVVEAQQQREPVQRVIDRLSQPYAWTVMLASIAVVLVWWKLLGVPLMETSGGQITGALYTGITLLIVASPCALIISTPTATLAAITRGARAGVLFKGGQSIERLSRLGAVAFDKTGTLTVGKPRVEKIEPIGWSDQAALLEVAAALEQESTHPIAAAIRDAAKASGVASVAISGGRFTAGRGVSGEYQGKEARLGTLVFTEPLIPVCLRAQVAQTLSGVQRHGQIGTVVTWDQQAGVIVLADEVRPGAAELVSQMHTLGVRPVCMLTGDNTATARHIAESLGIDRWHAELLPGDKVSHVQALKAEIASRGSRRAGVGVIGDGVNDAPALSAADVSIGIGSIGSDAALESADIVLLSDDLSVVPWAVGLARRARATITTNLTFSLSAIVVMVAATLVGSLMGYQLPLWLGVIGHEGGTLLVVANSLTLLAYRRARHAAGGSVATQAGAALAAAPHA